MKILQRLSLIIMLILSTSACSLLEVKLESGVVPLSQEQLNMRLFSRDFIKDFYAQVEKTADEIALINQQSEQYPLIKSNSLMWKINAEQAVQNTIFQSSPLVAMVDTWVLTAQLTEFYETGAGKNLFFKQQKLAIETSQALQSQFEQIAKGFLSNAAFNQNKEFVTQYVQNNPLQDITFNRKSAFLDWLAFREITQFEAINTFGSAPEVMSDMADRMAMISEQMPKILGWKVELYSLHSNLNAEQIQQTLLSISETSTKFQQLMLDSPEMMQTLAINMRQEISPLIQQLSDAADDKLMQLGSERAALVLMIKTERIALEEMVKRERMAAVVDLDTISQNAVKVVFQELTKMIKSVIIYFILFILVIFFAPLGLGIWLGKRLNNRKNNKLDQVKLS
jgi:hypothetical protein